MSRNIFNPSHLQQLCKQYGLVLSRKYGQNFLINPESIEAMIKAADLSTDDAVIEVGPGFGALTFALAEKAGKVIAFEIEKKLKPYWDEQLKKYKNVEIVWGNVLLSLRGATSRSDEAIPLNKDGTTIQGDPSSSARGGFLGMTRLYKVISNLPYQITSSVIRLFLEGKRRPDVMVFMAQKEVAERICAKPGAMSVLAISVQYYADPEIITQVPRSYFWPAPAVDSAVIRLSFRAKRGIPLIGSASLIQGDPSSSLLGMTQLDFDKLFFKVVKAGFANRRKMLFKNLLPLVDKDKVVLKKIFAEAGIAQTVRAQELSVEEWRVVVKIMIRVF